MHLVVTGGGTGGHIYPAIAVAEYELRHQQGTTVQFIGSSAGPEAVAAQSAGIPFKGLDVAGVVGKSPVKAAKAILKFLRASRDCRAILQESGAGCVLGTGGYASAPACRAAIKLNIPLVLHEMNYEPGMVTRIFSKRAAAVALAYEGTASLLPPRAVARLTGVPVRPEIEALASTTGRARARCAALGELGLEDGRKTLLVFGGSQGAEALNEAMWSAVPDIVSHAGLQVIHLVGRKNIGSSAQMEAERAAGDGALLYRTFDYMERMDLAYAVADLALSRAGAGTIAELMAIGLPAVLVPFPHATGGHQE
ncbi:MAG: UDP-N-acetylglucosamine--N-acetylmuramyl-(pentapeptide) pyrophosphoryl-undecaprenol N-acetylglucosamine transferase, partial [Candidatus Geothermincolia bacterium]